MSPPLPAREARVGYGHDPGTEGERGTEGLNRLPAHFVHPKRMCSDGRDLGWEAEPQHRT